jgi:hypothetical protein
MVSRLPPLPVLRLCKTISYRILVVAFRVMVPKIRHTECAYYFTHEPLTAYEG